MQDAIYGHVNKNLVTIFGFAYDPKKHESVCLRKARLLVANKDDFKFGEKIPNSIDFINQIEDKLEIKRSIVFQCEEPPLQYIRGGVYLFEGSSRWLKSPPMISFYSLAIRLGFSHVIGESYEKTIEDIASEKKTAYQPVDNQRLRDAKDGITRILAEGDLNIFSNSTKDNYLPQSSMGVIHNNCGIGGFSKQLTKAYFPAWHNK